MEEENIDRKEIKKCLKSYLMGKKLINTDKDKAFEYFKQTLKYIKLLKNNTNYKEIINETETDCNKYINQTIEDTIGKNNNTNIELDLFQMIETGDMNELKKVKSYQIDFNIFDNTGNTPIHKAIKYGDAKFLKEAFKLGASIDIINLSGNTALEYACLERDPSIINFLLKNGCDMKKHLLFRDGSKKYDSKQNYIDINILLKMIFSYQESETYEDLKFILNIFNENEKIGFNEYNYLDLIKCLNSLLKNITLESKETYLTIIRDELSYPLKKSLGCPYNKLEILLTYLVPFIDYPFFISEDWYINLELKYLIIKLLKESSSFNAEIKAELINYLWINYVKNNILPDEYLGNLISQWVSKIKA